MRERKNFIAFADNRTIIERIKEYLESSDWNKKYFEKDVAEILGLNNISMASSKKRDDHVFKMVVVDWCMDQDMDPRVMVAK